MARPRDRARHQDTRHLMGCWQDGRLLLLDAATGVRSSLALPLSAAPPSSGPWSEWPPAAALFHAWAKHTRFTEGAPRAASEAALRHQGVSSRPPSPIKRHPGAPTVRLPKVGVTGEFTDVLLGRRTWRGFSLRPVPLRSLASLLHLTWGVQGWGQAGAGDRVAFKTSPSGGARHAIEAYVMALRVQGVPRGLYHYVAATGELERIGSRGSGPRLVRYLQGQWWYQPAAAVVFMTAVLPRVWWRYRSALAYRSVLFEAGHFCQTFCLVATWLGLAPFCTAALDATLLERDLGLDGVNEVVLYAAGVGSRPGHGRWVQWPARRPRVLR